MNTYRNGLLLAILIGFTVSSGYSQGSSARTQTVAFDNPGRQGTVYVTSGEGDVSIIGYAGKEVLIKASAPNKKTSTPDDDPKAKGLKRISGSGFYVTTDREENAIVITRPIDDATDLEIRVPFNTALKIGGASSRNTSGNASDIQSIVASSVGAAIGFSGGLFEGTITVEDIAGEMELSTLDGDITLKNVSGAVIANCMDGDITAVFRNVPENRPMAFSSVDGDIDVTLPVRIKTTILASNVDGNINTDFDMETVPGVVKRDSKESSGVIEALIGTQGKTITGKINGGGPTIRMKTIDGNIYIRKAK